MSVKKLLNLIPRQLRKYATFSILVTILDISIVFILTRFFSVPIVIANTIGVVTGFITHYLLASKSVFDTNYGIKGLAIYLGTFGLSLALSDGLIFLFYNHARVDFQENLRLLLSKALAGLIPFFIIFYLRKVLFSLLKRKMSQYRS
jgi:putative flippase GtrA